jgi:hypothetical protein
MKTRKISLKTLVENKPPKGSYEPVLSPVNNETFSHPKDGFNLNDFVQEIIDSQTYPAYINYFDFDSASETNIINSNAWYKLNTNTTSLFSRNGLVHTNNRVTNTSNTKILKIEGIVSISAGNNQELHAAFFKNGQLYPCSEQSNNTGGGLKVVALPFHCVVELQKNEYIEVWVKNKTGTTNITLDNINVIVQEM